MLPVSDLLAITVARHRTFAANEWRNAIIHFLNGMWSNKHPFRERPELSFGPVTLHLDRGDTEDWQNPRPYGPRYLCWGKAPERIEQLASYGMNTELPSHEYLHSGNHLRVEGGSLLVHDALGRFVFDNSVSSLTIVIKPAVNSPVPSKCVDQESFRLMKSTERNEYFISSDNLCPTEYLRCHIPEMAHLA